MADSTFSVHPHQLAASTMPSENCAIPHYFDDAGNMHQYPSYPTLVDSSSFPHPGPQFLLQRNTSRPHPPALQTANLLDTVHHSHNSAYFDHQQSCEQLQTPMTPADSSFYMNGSAAESITTFSPSSNTSAELDSAEGTSPTAGDSPSSDTLRDEAMNAGHRAGNDGAERKKRNSRRMWTHSLEKYIFTPHEIATLGTPHRRTIYSASLEAHIDRLHSQLLGIEYYPVHFDDLQVYRGLNCKIAKSMVAGLQHDFVQVRTRLLEIERATNNLQEMAAMRVNHERIGMQNQ